jgi:hypothetical protein
MTIDFNAVKGKEKKQFKGSNAENFFIPFAKAY